MERDEKKIDPREKFIEGVINFVDTPVEIVYFSFFVIGFLIAASFSLVSHCGNVSDIELYKEQRVSDIQVGSVIRTSFPIAYGSNIIEEGTCGIIRDKNLKESTVLVHFLHKSRPAFLDDEFFGGSIARYFAINPIGAFVFVTESPPIFDLQVDAFEVTKTRPFTNFVRWFYLSWLFWIILFMTILGIILFRLGVKSINEARGIWEEKIRKDKFKAKAMKSSVDLYKHKNNWEKVKKLMEVQNEQSWREAVLLADSIVEDTLKASGFVGESFGEIVRNMEGDKLYSLDDIWVAHKIRNRIAHPTERFFLRRGDAEKAINSFEIALDELGFFE